MARRGSAAVMPWQENTAITAPTQADAEHRRWGNEAHGCPNEITVYRSAKLSFDKGFEARSSFVNFADPGIRGSNVSHELKAKRGSHDARGITGPAIYDTPEAETLRRVLTSPLFFFANMTAIAMSFFLWDLFVFLQVPDNALLDGLLTIGFSIFTFELICRTVSDKKYPGSIDFWGDVFGTFSLIFDISYLWGPDAQVPEEVHDGSRYVGVLDCSALHLMARLARFVSRMGQLIRLIKLQKILHEGAEDQRHLRVSAAIAGRMTDVISTRVASTIFCVAAMLLMSDTVRFPKEDESMVVWVQSLAADTLQFKEAVPSEHAATTVQASVKRLNSELRRLVDFYRNCTYGPYSACYGHEDGAGGFVCENHKLGLQFDPIFTKPLRPGSSSIYYAGNFQVAFNLANPQKLESLRSMTLVCVIIIVLILFSMLMISNVSAIALAPMEQVLDRVRQRCGEIFKYTNVLKDTDDDDEDEEINWNDIDKVTESEFHMLETALTKLAAIATFSQRSQPVGICEDEDLTENAMMILNWMGEKLVSTSDGGMARQARNVARTGDMGQTVSDKNMGLRPGNLVKNVREDVINSITGADFDAFEVATEHKSAVTCYIIITAEGCAEWVAMTVEQKTLCNFLNAAQKEYLPNPFHNFSHALDTVYSVAYFISCTGADYFLPEEAQFWLLVSAAGHDLGHLGVNNDYLIETGHDLALTYNDRSPLENLHCSKLFDIIRQPECNVFKTLEKEVYKEVRKGMIEAILHTDITKHNEMIKEVNLLYQVNSSAFREQATTNEFLSTKVQFIASLLLHCADVSNPMKPWTLCQKIAKLVLDEFFDQGDKEKKLGLPVSMLNDREKVSRPNSQVGFMEFMLLPMVESVVLVLPGLYGLAQNLARNIQNWTQIWEDEAQPTEEATEKVRQRVKKVVARCEAVLPEGRPILRRGSGGTLRDG